MYAFGFLTIQTHKKEAVCFIVFHNFPPWMVISERKVNQIIRKQFLELKYTEQLSQ